MATNVSVALDEVTRPTKGLNIVLWILQILAASAFLLACGLKLAGAERWLALISEKNGRGNQ